MESTLTTEELLAQNKTWCYSRTDRNGTRYFSDSACQRCGGSGVIHYYYYVDGGVCFECGGSGRSTARTIKVYTPAHAEKLKADREKREEARRIARLKDFEANWNSKLEAYGFGIENGKGVCYRIVGNTYEIKDQLKKLGCKFKSSLGWYAPHALEGYETQKLDADKVVGFNRETLQVEWVEDKTVQSMWSERKKAAEESTSSWVGEVGARITVKAHIDRVFESEFQVHPGPYGIRTSYMYLMHDESGNVYKWSTSKDYREGEDLTLKATVKDHAEYRGIKQTVLTRGARIDE